MIRNPRSGAVVEIPAARVPYFKVGKALWEAVDLPSEEVPVLDDDRMHSGPGREPSFRCGSFIEPCRELAPVRLGIG
jgi:hypothetical protein